MGCFNVACNLTNVSMYVEKALWVPLVPSHNGENSRLFDGNMFIHPIAVYTPVACPVFGNLDSYGRLENIERTPNVEAIEKYFGASINDIIAEPGRYSVDELDGSPRLSGTFVSAEAFEWSKTNTYDECGNNITNLTTSHIDTKILEICDFHFIRTDPDPDRGRYNQLFTSARYPGIEWWSDGTWGHFGDEVHTRAYDPIRFLEILEEKTGVEADAQVLHTLKTTRASILGASETIDKYESEKARFAMMAKALKELDESLPVNLDFAFFSKREIYAAIACEGAKIGAGDVLDKLYGHNLKLFVEDIANLNDLHYALLINNRFWSPQANGLQYGSLYQERATAQWVIDRANRRLKAYADEDDD